jgi:hypothetical protein
MAERSVNKAILVGSEDWLRTPQTIVMPKPSRLSIRVSGLDTSKVRAAWMSRRLGLEKYRFQ